MSLSLISQNLRLSQRRNLINVHRVPRDVFHRQDIPFQTAYINLGHLVKREIAP